MGYNTTFKGKMELSKKVNREFFSFINGFGRTRHMKRDTKILMEIFPDWKERCFGGVLGPFGAYFIDEDSHKTADVADYNMKNPVVPGLWCDWKLSSNKEKELMDGEVEEVKAYLEWNGSDKSYYLFEWIEFLIENFFAPNGISLTGIILSIGEEFGDAEYICVVDNKAGKINAYTSTAKDSVINWISNCTNDCKLKEKAQNSFDKVFMNMENLEYEWDYDD